MFVTATHMLFCLIFAIKAMGLPLKRLYLALVTNVRIGSKLLAGTNTQANYTVVISISCQMQAEPISVSPAWHNFNGQLQE
jgi:hypothetical protein